jgi:hypothetical protein
LGYTSTMKTPKVIAFCVGLLFWMAPSAYAQVSETKPAKANPNQVVTRSELITDLDKILSNWESRTENYVTKGEVDELRTLLTQIREEMGDLGEREGQLETDADEVEQRSEHTRRPGF